MKMKSNPDDDSLGDAYVPNIGARDYIGTLELLITRIRLVEMLSKAPRKAARSLVQHYVWLWRRVVPMPEGMWPHEIKEAFNDPAIDRIIVIDLTQFKDETY